MICPWGKKPEKPKFVTRSRSDVIDQKCEAELRVECVPRLRDGNGESKFKEPRTKQKQLIRLVLGSYDFEISSNHVLMPARFRRRALELAGRLP